MLDIILTNWATHVYLVYLIVLLVLFVVYRRRSRESLRKPRPTTVQPWKRSSSPWIARWEAGQRQLR